jgi:hypothetical protein
MTYYLFRMFICIYKSKNRENAFDLGLFYGGLYHPIPLLENDQYERIRWLRWIVYHYNLHMWYRVVYIDGIWVLFEVLSRWHKWNIWFPHFALVNGHFFSNFKWKCSFQISKMNFFYFFNHISKIKFSIFFISNFCGIFQFFHFPVVVWSIFFSNFISNFKIVCMDVIVWTYNVVLAGLINCMHDVVSHIKSAR